MRLNISINWYLFKKNTCDTRSTHLVGACFCRTNSFKYSFFPYTIREWNKLDLQLRNEKYFRKFRNTLPKLSLPTPDIIYGIHHPLGLKLLIRLRLGLSQLNGYRFKHNFKTALTDFIHVLLKSSQLSIFSCPAIIIQQSVSLS